MNVVDCDSDREVTCVEEMEDLLRDTSRARGRWLWLSIKPNSFPTLSIMIKGEVATLGYFRDQLDAGLRPKGGVPSLDVNGTTTFAMSLSPGDDVTIVNSAIVQASTAVEAGLQFFLQQDLPKCIDWVNF